MAWVHARVLSTALHHGYAEAAAGGGWAGSQPGMTGRECPLALLHV